MAALNSSLKLIQSSLLITWYVIWIPMKGFLSLFFNIGK